MDSLGSFVQQFGSAVVAQPLPSFHDFVVRSKGKILDGRKRLQKRVPLWNASFYAGLLQHHLTQPGPVERRGFSPWQRSAIGQIPRSQCFLRFQGAHFELFFLQKTLVIHFVFKGMRVFLPP